MAGWGGGGGGGLKFLTALNTAWIVHAVSSDFQMHTCFLKGLCQFKQLRRNGVSVSMHPLLPLLRK